MSSPTTPGGVIDAETSGLKGDLLAVAGTGLGIGVVLFVLRKGWRLFKGFTS